MFVLKILQIYALNLTPNINKHIESKYHLITRLVLNFFIVTMIFLTNFHAIQQTYVIFYYSSGKYITNPLQSKTLEHITQAINKINSALMLNIWYWKRKQISETILLIWKYTIRIASNNDVKNGEIEGYKL